MFILSKYKVLRLLSGIGLAILLNMAVYAAGSLVNIGANGISVTATVSDMALMELRIAGPGDFYTALRSESDYLNWSAPYGLVDGEYRYEVFMTIGTAQEEGRRDNTQLYRENGRFIVEGGVLSPKQNEIPVLPDEHAAIPPSWLRRYAEAVLDLLIPPVKALPIVDSAKIQGAIPILYFSDTDTADPDNDWNILADEYAFSIWNYDTNHAVYYVDDETPFFLYQGFEQFHLYNYKSGGPSLYIDDDAGLDVFYAVALGNIELADGVVFIDKSENRVGIGTITPSAKLDLRGTDPAMEFDGTAANIKVKNEAGNLRIFYKENLSGPDGTVGDVLTIENTLDSTHYPGLGIWQSDPVVPLQVESHDGMSANLLVKNPVAPTATGDVSMFELRNTGDKIVRFTVNAGGGQAIWTFDNEPTYNGGAGANSGRFRIAKSGTGVAEFTVDGYGNGQFYGNSYAVNHINTSSRETKTDFQALDERDVLAKLMQLEVSAWRYKQEGKDARHIGPVAEDFQQVFGLGDGKHISTVDSEGIALAAIKAIKAEKDAEIEALRRDNEALKITNKALADRMQALEELMRKQQLMQVSSR
jgi:hypothetical protein